MSNWSQPPASDQPPAGNNNARRSGLLRGYGQQGFDQQSPASQPLGPPMQPPQPRVPSSNLPSQALPPQVPQGPISPLPNNQMPPQGWFAGQVQRVRGWSGKMAATYNGRTQVAAPPPAMAVNRRTSIQSGELPGGQKKTPWRRSRALRMIMQHRRQRREILAHKRVVTPLRIWLGVVIAFLLLIVITVSSGTAYAYSYYQSQLPILDGIANKQISQTTRIYDRNMTPLFDAYDLNGGGRRTPVSYDQIPQVMRDAQVAIEDHTFWTNSGVDPQGILRNIPSYLSSTRASGGGSGITQQLIKNLRDDARYSIDRKISEAALAIGLTQQYPKTKILEMYFNVAAYGSLELGAEAAAEDYFHLKPQCDKNFSCTPGITRLSYNDQTRKDDPILGLARASLLAGMPQNPDAYDPTRGETHFQLALNRQKEVLNAMMTYGFQLNGQPITLQMAQQAEALTAKMKFTPYSHYKRDPHFVDWVVAQLEQTLGVATFLNGGFNIRTTIDSNLEQYVENAVVRHLTKPEYQMFPVGHYATLNKDNNVNDAAVVVLNSKTGEILAMDGSLDYNSRDPRVGGSFNAVDPLYEGTTGRPVGSTFKPLVYATAFEMGWYPGIVLPDFRTYFPNGASAGIQATQVYMPNDYGGKPNNVMSTIRFATADSYNIPAVKALQFVGIDNILTKARLMGFKTLDMQLNSLKCKGQTTFQCLGISTVLGTNNSTLLEMAGAYQTFADEGMHVPTTGVLDIWDNYGHNLYHFNGAQVQGTRVFSKEATYMMTSVLSDENARYPEFLNDHDLSFWDWDYTCHYSRRPYPDCTQHQVAAKTGTTDFFKDNWTIGYTPNVVVGVWAGNANDESMGNNVVGITGAAPIWHSVMEFVSGRPCGQIDPDIQCTPLDRASLNLNQPTVFPPPPPGIHLASVSSANGLQGTGTYDWVWNGLDPQVAGMPQNTDNNGNNNNGGGDNGKHNKNNNNGNGNNGN